MSQAIDFMNEMNSLKDAKLPISRQKVQEISMLAIENDRQYKYVVFHIEKFLKNCPNDKILPAIYVMDSIMKCAHLTYETKEDVFTLRLLKSLPKLIPQLPHAPNGDKDKILKVFGCWNQKEIFPSKICMLCIDYLTDVSDEKLAILTTEVQTLVSSKDFVDIYNKTVPVRRQHLPKGQTLKHSHSAPSTEKTQTFLSKAESSFMALLDALDYTFKVMGTDDLPIALSLLENSFANADSHVMNHFSDGNTSFLGESEYERAMKLLEELDKHLDAKSRTKLGENKTDGNKVESNCFNDYFKKSSEEKPVKSEFEMFLGLKDTPEFRSYTKKKHVTVFSDTVWIGKIPKPLLVESDLKEEIFKFGQILKLNLIINRGCAYVQMNRRSDASSLKEHFDNYRISKSIAGIKTSWALPSEFIDSLKNFWDLESGICYIPWSHFRQHEFDLLKKFKALMLYCTLPPNFHPQITPNEILLDQGIHHEFFELQRQSQLAYANSNNSSNKRNNNNNTPRKNDRYEMSNRRSRSPRDSRRSSNRSYDSPNKRDGRRGSDSNHRSSNRVSPPKHSSLSRNSHLNSNNTNTKFKSNYTNNNKYQNHYQKNYDSPHEQRHSTKHGSSRNTDSRQPTRASPVWLDEGDDAPPSSKQTKVDNHSDSQRSVDKLESMSPQTTQSLGGNSNSASDSLRMRQPPSSAPLRLVSNLDSEDNTITNSQQHGESEKKMTTSEAMIGKLLQGYASKKNMSKASQDRPLDRMKANLFNGGANAVNNIDFKNHEEFARFVFDNNALQEALNSQLGSMFPGHVQDEQSIAALISNIPAFLNKLGSPDQMNLSLGGSNLSQQSKQNNNDLDILPPPPPPK